MCNISGYIGNRRAAPILIDMIKRQEGFCGGYYTGIITIHEGKLYTAKVVGDVDRLLAETDALNFPGTCGLIHSRSKSGGDVHHAHPFVSQDGNLAMVLNGGVVRYAPVYDGSAIARELYALGVRFDTETEYTDAMKGHCILPNGNCVHNSEVICHYTDYGMKNKGLTTAAALEQAFIRMPQESVALAMNVQDGHTITFANYNMPMCVARTEEEVFLSSMSIAFPTDRDFFVSDYILPASSGSITVEETRVHRFRPALPIGNLTPEIVHEGYAIIMKMLQEEAPCSIGRLNNGVRGLWGELIDQRYPLTYSVLQDLQNAGKLEIVKAEREGIQPGLTAPLYQLALK